MFSNLQIGCKFLRVKRKKIPKNPMSFEHSKLSFLFMTPCFAYFQPSLSLDSTIETLLIKSENDFISVEQDKEPLSARKRHSQQLNQAPSTVGHYQHQHQHQQQQKRDDNIRQLLDVTNTLTFEELRDFEMR